MSQPPSILIRSTAVVPHDPAWAAAFQSCADEIAAVLGAELSAIHHAGSTAIPGIRAKPIIDIVVEARRLAALDDCAAALAALGYEARGEHGIAGRRFFIRNRDGQRAHHVHGFQAGHPEIERMLNLRDFLRSHPEDAQAYSQLKQALSRQFPSDIGRYTDGKSAFIEAILHRAQFWRKQPDRDESGTS
jgi:GrpB-like predicted nucleotidyltransferase (UPF0157 family)